MGVSFAGLKKMIHRKSPEYLTGAPFGNNVAGSFLTASVSPHAPRHDLSFYVGGASIIWLYDADEDSWVQLPNSGITGTFGAGACGEARQISAPGGAQILTAASGATSASQLPTNLNLTRSLVGVRVRIVAGPGAGYDGLIAGNNLGAGAILTLATPASATPTNASQFILYAGSLWFLNSGAGAIGFSVYDVATNTWTARSVASLPTTWGTDGQLVGTEGSTGNATPLSSGTASSGAALTLTDSSKTGALAWPTNAWTNAQVRITSGTGAGQIRAIASNTGTALTIFTAWATNPDATSTYVVEGNDDQLFLVGNNAVTAYRYAINTNTWTQLAPGTARGGAPGAGLTADWIDDVPDANWSEGGALLYSTLTSGLIRQRGRYIYSFQGGASNVLAAYDIAGNTWINSIPYGNQMETLTTGSCSTQIGGRIYIQKEATGRLLVFDVALHTLLALGFNPLPQGAAIAGDKMIVLVFRDGVAAGSYLYTLGNTRADFIRYFLV